MNGCLEKGKFPEELMKILKSLALEWGDDVDQIGNDDYLEVIHLTNSFSNHIYKVNWGSKSQNSVLVRIYGERRDLFLDSEEEIKTFEWMSNHGYGPRLYGHFPNGRVEQFINGRTLSPDDLHNPDIAAIIATKIREFHTLEKPGSTNPVLWGELRKLLNDAKTLSSAEIKKEFGLESLEEEINVLENILSNDSSQQVVFCHSDLRGDNMIFNETTKHLTLIDYEYACYNPAAYDLANHFCEMSANYNSETPHILDYSKYPGREERHRFIRIYLTYKGYQPTQFEIEKLDDDVEKYTLANHLNFGLWAIITEAQSNIPDFNLLEFARQRFKQYWLRKSKVLEYRTCNA
ncbi:hypothetical protein K7X08_022949 [Anisodus acutangulus]|uniref:Choline/ethanolamine kinase n=1 Tax=Anisodus acutangulus TaxID=402998 RepID=A0A9Q1RHP5_9SOLA|nr:hypothetical protein K7X08_022949 [Anisodus acutangulus]